MLRDEINRALKSAMKEQDKDRLATLRLINAAIKDRDILNQGQGKPPVDDKQLQAILVRMVKQREDSARLYQEGGRSELAASELNEVAIIRGFLPCLLSEEETQHCIAKAVGEVKPDGLRDIGKVMAFLKENYMGKIDFSLASSIIREKLKKLVKG
ncbi:GatB/YqeY domain-containing protein [Bartonella sp. DGB2]|uniref:GatB/YqeY domain-containing protein n=1 Tax=Bartonella sp. DGB2 TaxID=3388426 RepID=UPI0039901BF7